VILRIETRPGARAALTVPRNPSWVAGVAPSSEMETALAPAAATSANRAGVASGVTEGASDRLNPFARP
jgi:hypothetical protein